MTKITMGYPTGTHMAPKPETWNFAYCWRMREETRMQGFMSPSLSICFAANRREPAMRRMPIAIHMTQGRRIPNFSRNIWLIRRDKVGWSSRLVPWGWLVLFLFCDLCLLSGFVNFVLCFLFFLRFYFVVLLALKWWNCVGRRYRPSTPRFECR